MTEPMVPPTEDIGYRTGSAVHSLLVGGLKKTNSRYLFLARALALLLGGYLLFDRAFAWIHVPGTPLFVGEIVLAIGLYIAFRSKEAVRFVRLSPPMQLLVTFMAFGALLTIVGFANYDPIDAIRDGAIWYYGLFAVIVGSLAKAWEPAYDLFVRYYLLVMPTFLVVGLARLYFANRENGVFLPDSDVLLTSHKPGNLGIHAIMLVAFLLLVAAPELDKRQRARNIALTVGGLMLMALAGTQNRGALVAGFVALVMVYVAGRSARPLMGMVVLIVLGAMTLAFAFNLRFELQRREVSVDQFVTNVFSVFLPDSGEEANDDGGTVEWRLKLWDLVIEDTLSADRFLSGFGFGPNLASRYGFVAGAEVGPDLRNPHNSHLSVMARMGLVGAGLWVALWAMWYRQLWKARRRFRFVGEDQKAGFLAWCMVAVTAHLINGIFDPSLEGPQAAVWVWFIFGLGAFVAVEGTVVRWRQRIPVWARQDAAV